MDKISWPWTSSIPLVPREIDLNARRTRHACACVCVGFSFDSFRLAQLGGNRLNLVPNHILNRVGPSLYYITKIRYKSSIQKKTARGCVSHAPAAAVSARFLELRIRIRRFKTSNTAPYACRTPN